MVLAGMRPPTSHRAASDGLRRLHLKRRLELILALRVLLTRRYLHGGAAPKRPAMGTLLGPQLFRDRPILQVERRHRHEPTANLQKHSQQGADETPSAPNRLLKPPRGRVPPPWMSAECRRWCRRARVQTAVPQPWIQLLNATNAVNDSLHSIYWRSHTARSLRISCRTQTDDVEVVPEPHGTSKVVLQRLISC